MKAEIITITDESGSMESLRNSAIQGYNAFLREQRDQPGEARVTDVRFNNTVRTIYRGLPIALVPSFYMTASGSTALNDAIGQTLTVEGERIAREGWADLVIVNILTDGFENASKEYTEAQVKNMIEHAQTHGWKFIYQAANQDARVVSQRYGFDKGLVQNFQANAAGTVSAYASNSASTTALRGGKHFVMPEFAPVVNVNLNVPAGVKV